MAKKKSYSHYKSTQQNSESNEFEATCHWPGHMVYWWIVSWFDRSLSWVSVGFLPVIKHAYFSCLKGLFPALCKAGEMMDGYMSRPNCVLSALYFMLTVLHLVSASYRITVFVLSAVTDKLRNTRQDDRGRAWSSWLLLRHWYQLRSHHSSSASSAVVDIQGLVCTLRGYN